MNVKQALQWAEQTLHSTSDASYYGIDPKLDGQFLLVFVLQKTFTWLKTWPDQTLDLAQIDLFTDCVSRRLQGEPIAYITGHKAFWTLDLETNPSTLIPRAETELLVELSLARLAAYTRARVLDLGTGTGAIALSIASERKQDQIVALDFNPDAVDLARRNAAKHQLSNVQIMQSNWFSRLEQEPNLVPNRFDLIVSNPPYVADNDPHLQSGDLRFEPNTALVSSGDGLDDIRLIVEQARDYLESSGALMVEHGYQQGEAVRNIFNAAGYRQVKTEKDLLGHDRVTWGLPPLIDSFETVQDSKAKSPSTQSQLND